jgi:hypothetical protein
MNQITSQSNPLIPPGQLEAPGSNFSIMDQPHVAQPYPLNETDAQDLRGQEADLNQRSSPEGSRYVPKGVSTDLRHWASHAPGNVHGSPGSTTTEWRGNVSSESLPRVKFLPMCLCFHDKLIVLKIEPYWSDSEVTQKILRKYWEVRGSWKRWPSTWKIWPWKVLRKIGCAKVCVSKTRVRTDFI